MTWPGADGTTWWADPTEDLGVVVMAHATAVIEPQIGALVLSSRS
ncbi:hypothetical protein ORV05_31220 [Amycolatopsis cynarae]|uniref:Uncharacterized protein n=1 Tax=Amycolatopsis cynarae TaxID=2995223 RepID=A0ABY7B353_9PSEU|nr:hypothetical protein [Amycolatopsis sp. HUAS 11-8]WAL65326.1 hypothetical protein ORV05_31220 [Amycolatopsis sp. HUAS 11-8]